MTDQATKPPDIRAVFFSKKTIWLAPNDLVRFQLQKELFSDESGISPLRGPWLTTFSSLEGLLAAELETPEVDGLIRAFILNDLAAPLAELLWPQGAGRPGRAEVKALAEDVADGLDRLKLAGLDWSQVAALPPPELAQPLAELGRQYDLALAEMGRADRFDRRRQVLEALRAGRRFKALEGAEEIVCRWSRRLSPFETDFIVALARGRQVRLTLHTPAWVRDENLSQGHASGFDLLRSIRHIEQSEEPGLWLDFAETGEGPAPPPLAFAAEALLAPPAYRHDPPEVDGHLRIVRTSSAYTEVEEAARRLKVLLRNSPAHELALVAPDLDSYGPLIDDVGRRFGLSFHFRRGETLADQGPARAVLELLTLWSSNWERSRLLDFLSKPYFRLTGLSAGALTRLFLEAGVTDNRAGGGFEENLA
ncbi:MAG: hypothetical protein LBV79_02355, partial [Candidatus Adiutrix sp.]|nr:hypothetical protein [Candidatus Adiutrix sp.]